MNADAAQMNVLPEELQRRRSELNQLSGQVIGAAQRVSSTLGIERPHRQQCLNYIRAAGLHLGLLLNFGRAHLEVGRVVFRS